MFDQKNKKLASLFLVLLFTSLCTATSEAASRSRAFGSSVFAIGLRAGYTPAAKFDMPPDPKSAPTATTFYAFEPEFDFSSMTLGVSVEYYAHPAYSTTGAGYTQQTTPTVINYNGRLKLIPYISEGRKFRTYYGLSYGLSTLKVKGERLDDATGLTTIETAKGSALNTQFFAGLEFFLAQNYSMSLEGGYRKLQIDKITFTSDKDAAGVARSKGDVVNRPDGNATSLGFSSYYVAAGLLLHF